MPDGEPTACLAYLAPRPDSETYAPFLVLVSRLWAGAARLGDSGVTGSPVYFTPLDDGSVVAVSAPVKRGETPAKAFERIETFVAETIEPKLGADEREAREADSSGSSWAWRDLPDEALGQNPYGVAFSLARRDQLGLDPARLDRAARCRHRQGPEARRRRGLRPGPARRRARRVRRTGPMTTTVDPDRLESAFTRNQDAATA